MALPPVGFVLAEYAPLAAASLGAVFGDCFTSLKGFLIGYHDSSSAFSFVFSFFSALLTVSADILRSARDKNLLLMLCIPQ
jgi:hypothetical protein